MRAQDSTLNPEGMAANDRNEQIIQATTIDELLAIDHTFETLKNYRLEGGKAIFTVLNEKAQICSLVIVPTQKLCEIDHMLNKMLKRKGMDFNDGKPRGLYTDTWPNNKEYWEKRLGPDTEGALGLFHYNQRVVKHLNPRHPHFYRVKDRFQRAVYKYNQDDLDALTNAFKDGHIKDKNGETYTQEALDEMRLSKNWKMNYTKYLRKEIPNGDQVDRNLNDFEAWLLDFFKTVPEDLFTSSLQKFREQLANNRKHANHIQDPEGIEMYRGVKPGKKALIQLVKWFSKRPESLIEMFHGLMRHFGNTGMRPEMADSLTLRGAAEYNLQREHKFQQMENDDGEVDCCWEHVPRYCRDQPLYSNPAFLHQVNELAKGKNMEPPFPHIRAMAPNNGEVFLSKYFKKQTERNQLQKPLDGGLCSCKECESCAIQFDTVASPVVQRENTSAGKNNSVQSVRNLSCSFQFFKCAHLLFSLKLKECTNFPSAASSKSNTSARKIVVGSKSRRPSPSNLAAPICVSTLESASSRDQSSECCLRSIPANVPSSSVSDAQCNGSTSLVQFVSKPKCFCSILLSTICRIYASQSEDRQEESGARATRTQVPDKTEEIDVDKVNVQK